MNITVGQADGKSKGLVKKKDWRDEWRTHAMIKEDLAYLSRITEGENREWREKS